MKTLADHSAFPVTVGAHIYSLMLVDVRRDIRNPFVVDHERKCIVISNQTPAAELPELVGIAVSTAWQDAVCKQLLGVGI